MHVDVEREKLQKHGVGKPVHVKLLVKPIYGESEYVGTLLNVGRYSARVYNPTANYITYLNFDDCTPIYLIKW